MMIMAIYDDGTEVVLTPAEAECNVFDAISNEMQNDRIGTFTHEDGTPVAFEITVRVRNPETTPICPEPEYESPLVSRMPHPDATGCAEYRAIYDVIETAEGDRALILAMLDSFEEWTAAVRREWTRTTPI